MLIFKGVFSPIPFNFQMVPSTKVPSKTKTNTAQPENELVLYRFPPRFTHFGGDFTFHFLTPRITWNNNPIHPSVRVVMLHFEHVNTKGRKNFLLEKHIIRWGHDHPCSANVPWKKLRLRVPMCHTFIHRGSAFSIPGSFFFLKIFLSQLYECSNRPTSPRMNPNSWRRVIVICALLSACESGLHKEIITH